MTWDSAPATRADAKAEGALGELRWWMHERGWDRDQEAVVLCDRARAERRMLEARVRVTERDRDAARAAGQMLRARYQRLAALLRQVQGPRP